jgi:hypothetical protein
MSRGFVRREILSQNDARRRIGLAMAFVALSRPGEIVKCGALSVRLSGHMPPSKTAALVAWFRGRRVAGFKVSIADQHVQCTGICERTVTQWFPLLDREARRYRYVPRFTPTHPLSGTVH